MTDRIDTVRAERRRRDDNSFYQTKNLAIPAEVAARLEAEGRTPRWVNDVADRIRQLTVLDDYDKVDGVDPVPVVIDRKTGETVMAHLLSKPKDFIVEDRRKAESRRREIEGAMVNGKIPTAPGAEPTPVQGAHGAGIYAPSSNSIGRANQITE